MPQRNALNLYPAVSPSAPARVRCCSPTSSVPARFASPYPTSHLSYRQPRPPHGSGSPSARGSHPQARWFSGQRLSPSRSLLSLERARIALWGECASTRSAADYCPPAVTSNLSVFNLSLWIFVLVLLNQAVYLAGSIPMPRRSLSSTSGYYQLIWNIKISCWADKIYFRLTYID